MPSKVFHGLDFDDKGQIVKQPPLHVGSVVYNAYQLDLMSKNHFDDLVRKVAVEKERRESEKRKRVLSDIVALDGFSNFLAGCAQAMACRAALRFGAGHRPYTLDGTGPGSKPASGEMWNVVDCAKLGNRLLRDSTPVKDKDGLRWQVNQLPMVWDMTPHRFTTSTSNLVTNDASNWLYPSTNQVYQNGSMFCMYRK